MLATTQEAPNSERADDERRPRPFLHITTAVAVDIHGGVVQPGYRSIVEGWISNPGYVFGIADAFHAVKDKLPVSQPDASQLIKVEFSPPQQNDAGSCPFIFVCGVAESARCRHA